MGNENHVGNPWEIIKSTVRKTAETQYLRALSKCGFKTRLDMVKALRVCSRDISNVLIKQNKGFGTPSPFVMPFSLILSDSFTKPEFLIIF